jgi:hypothetical protein
MASQSTVIGADNSTAVNVEDNALKVRPYTEFFKAVSDGNAYSWSNATYDYAAHDTVLGVENNSATMDLVIERVIISGSTATQWVVHTSSGVTMAGTAVTGVNLNRGSANVAPATAIGDETGNGQQAAGYTGRLISGRFANNGVVDIEVNGAIVIPQDHNIGIDFTTDGTAANCTIIGYFRTAT